MVDFATMNKVTLPGNEEFDESVVLKCLCSFCKARRCPLGLDT